MQRKKARLFGLSGVLVTLTLVAAACGADAGTTGNGGGDLSVSIASPADGASVPGSFTVELDAGVALADPSTGEHHVHLCFDGADCESEYTLAYGDSIPVSGLAPGSHTIEASLRNADHSDAGAATDSITVTVTEGGSAPSSDPGTGGSPSPTPDDGY